MSDFTRKALRAIALGEALHDSYPTQGSALDELILIERNEALTELRDHLQRITAGDGKTLRCAFCGEPYPEGTPAHKSEVLTAHVRVCKFHPIGIENRALREKVTKMGGALVTAQRDAHSPGVFEAIEEALNLPPL